MQFIKFNFSLLAFLLVSSAFAVTSFTPEECLNATYKTEVSHKGQPFGLTQNILRIEKEACLINLYHERYKFLKKEWLVDVCRSPVHIKSGAGAVDVLRRKDDCPQQEAETNYCREVREMRTLIEDDGLIFAEGDKERLSDPHGQVSCVVQLLELYLEQGVVLTRSKGIPQQQAPEQEQPEAAPLETIEEEATEEVITL